MKESKNMELKNEFFTVKISIDSNYRVGSKDNKYYDIEINPDDYESSSDYYTTLSIHVETGESEMSIALVGDLYSDDTNCAHLDGNVLTILQNDKISRLNISDGTLLFHTEVDSFGCNIALKKITNGYIIFGENDITMLDLNFNKKWVFAIGDIFVYSTEEKAFEIRDNLIRLYDFDNNYYEIDLNGKLVYEKMSKK